MGRVTPGAKATAKWMKRNRVSIGELSRRTGIDRPHLSRILRGLIKSVSVTNAVAIARETDGAVQVEAFAVEKTAWTQDGSPAQSGKEA